MCADVAKVTSLETDERSALADPGMRWVMDAARFLDDHNGPALIVTPERSSTSRSGRSFSVCLQNQVGDVLAEALMGGNPALQATVARSLSALTPGFLKVTLDLPVGNRYFEVTCVPLAQVEDGVTPPTALVFAKETTLDTNLTQALVESRQMFKDLVSCSDDFAWETDADGIFRYVSPRGAFGYGAEEMAGRPATEFLAGGADGDNPFTTRERIELSALEIKAANGRPVRVRLSALPVTNKQGEWLGARGLCRDVDRLATAESERALTDRRLAFNMRLTGLLRDMTAPRQLLQAFARATAEALDADCFLFRERGGKFQCHGASRNDIHINVLTLIGSRIADLDPDVPTTTGDGIEVSADGMLFSVFPILHHRRIRGAMVLHRKSENTNEGQEALFADAIDQLGIALDLIANREAVRALSLHDELTGLLTLKAFEAEVSKRINHQSRTGRHAVLMFLDLDDFEIINERYGHACGEAALRETAALLEERSRVGDLVCRVSRERFALWLDGAEARGAAQKVKLLVTLAGEIGIGMDGKDGAVLSLSAGGVVSVPGAATSIRELTERAVIALGQAKQGGRGSCNILAGASESNTGGADV